MNELEQTGGQGTPAAKEPKVIKRYTNRKLYDTVESRYVTLDEIAEMIKQGTEVKIVDNKTKEDLTSVTLAQIVFEEEKKKSRMPLSVLREIIRHPGESITDFIQKEVSPRVASIREEAQDRLDKLLRREGEEGGAVSPAAGSGTPAEMLKASQRALEEWQRRIDERVKTVVESLTGNLPALGRDMHALLQKLETLEKKVEELEKQRPGGRADENPQG
jgi:polyhydroxyalkanoate synthesis repressor PhaR